MSMTKKDFTLIATALKQSRADYEHNNYETQIMANAVIDVVVGNLEMVLRNHFPNFDAGKFRAKVM